MSEEAVTESGFDRFTITKSKGNQMKKLISCLFGLLLAMSLNVCLYGQDDNYSALKSKTEPAMDDPAYVKLSSQLDREIAQAWATANAIINNDAKTPVISEDKEANAKTVEIIKELIVYMASTQNNNPQADILKTYIEYKCINKKCGFTTTNMSEASQHDRPPRHELQQTICH